MMPVLMFVAGCSVPDRGATTVDVTGRQAELYASPEASDAPEGSADAKNAMADADLSFMSRPSGGEWDSPLAEMPEPTVALPAHWKGDMRKEFNDSNFVHRAEAEQLGITPLTDTRSHWHLRRPIVKIESCADFYVEPLRYSRPYLVPEAAAMLHEIGRRFNDTLAVRGGGDYRIKVTSVLRTPETVARLRRGNKNAVDSSVHQYGTTIDISYARFAADSKRIARSAVDLKMILAEVLKAMRDEGKCWIKLEYKQPCFHITARQTGK